MKKLLTKQRLLIYITFITKPQLKILIYFMRIKKILAYILIIVASFPIVFYVLINLFSGSGRKMDQPIKFGNIKIPVERTFSFQNNSDLKQKILDGWTSKTPKDWKQDESLALSLSQLGEFIIQVGSKVLDIKLLLRSSN